MMELSDGGGGGSGGDVSLVGLHGGRGGDFLVGGEAYPLEELLRQFRPHNVLHLEH